MKLKLFPLILLLATCVAAQTPAPPSQPITGANDPNVVKARNLLHQMIQAMGGDAWLHLQDSREDGRSYTFYHGNPSGAGHQYWRFWKYPDKERWELTKQRDVIEIFNGTQGWEITYKGTHPMDADDLKEHNRRQPYALEDVLRGWLNQPTTALFYEGAGLANNRAVDVVTIMNGERAETFSIDSDTHLLIKRAFTLRDKEGYRDEEAEIYDNYHPIQGIQTPLSLTLFHNGDMTRQYFRHTVQYNTGIADSEFTANVTVPKKK